MNKKRGTKKAGPGDEGETDLPWERAVELGSQASVPPVSGSCQTRAHTKPSSPCFFLSFFVPLSQQLDYPHSPSTDHFYVCM